jgi:two-component system, cell cycle sensor histidine kinase and response regulator CckA
MSLFWKIYSIVFIAVFVCFAAASLVISNKHVSDLQDQIVDKHALLAKFLAKEVTVGIISGNWPFETLHKLSASEGVLFWWIVQPDGVIYLADQNGFVRTRAHDYFPQFRDRKASTHAHLDWKKNLGLRIEALEDKEGDWSLWLGYSLKEISDTTRHGMATATALFVTVMVILGLMLFLIIKHFLNPINPLVAASSSIGNGDLATRVSVTTRDELGQLAVAFNDMAHALHQTTVSRTDLERLVEARTEDLRAINEELKGQMRERLLAEEALKESESKFRSIVENSVAGMFTVDEAYHFIYVNDELCEILGRSRECLLGLDFREVLAEDSRELVTDRYVRRKRGEKIPSRYEIKVFRGDGTIRQLEMLVAVVRDASGSPRTLGQLIDVTDRKQAEESLRIERERFQMLSDRAPLGMAKIAMDGTYEYVNPKFTEIFGYDLSDIPNRWEWLRKAYPDSSYRQKVVAAWDEDLEGIAPGGRASRVFEVTCKDGGQKTIQFMGVKLRADEYLMTYEDITGRMRAERALRDSEEKYRTLFENSIDAVYMTTRDGILIDANRAFLDLFGFSREEARNMEILRMYTDAADRKHFQETIERKKSVKDHEISFRKKDGTIIECLLTSTVRRDKNDAILGYHGIIRDVTEHKQLQRQLIQAQKMEAVGTLAGGIAHDFNNLLQAILGYTDLLLLRKKPEDPDRQKLEIVRQAARDGADLVSRILTFSMKAEFKARPTDLNREIRRVEKLLLRTVPKMIKIDLVLADDVWIIDADPAQIEQVLLNLTVNAQHAMPDGGRLLIETSNVSLGDDYVRTHLKAKPGKYVLLTVSDSGVGMKPDIVDRIFEPFFTTKASGQGTGLGLAIVHGIVSQHGGYIRCYSEPSLGTSFKIYFPVSSAQSVLDLAVTREMPAFGTETILLVDDDDRIRDLALQMIEMGGYKVLAASSGEEALKMYAAHRGEVDLVILDLIMPGMGGKRCLEELLRIDPDSRVLIASGYSSNGLTINETGSGARGFVRKPYDAKDILISIRKVLDRNYL